MRLGRKSAGEGAVAQHGAHCRGGLMPNATEVAGWAPERVIAAQYRAKLGEACRSRGPRARPAGAASSSGQARASVRPHRLAQLPLGGVACPRARPQVASPGYCEGPVRGGPSCETSPLSQAGSPRAVLSLVGGRKPARDHGRHPARTAPGPRSTTRFDEPTATTLLRTRRNWQVDRVALPGGGQKKPTSLPADPVCQCRFSLVGLLANSTSSRPGGNAPSAVPLPECTSQFRG